ncbi:hypothetical protein COOONC_03045 [Cooperia oncophora]
MQGRVVHRCIGCKKGGTRASIVDEADQLVFQVGNKMLSPYVHLCEAHREHLKLTEPLFAHVKPRRIEGKPAHTLRREARSIQKNSYAPTTAIFRRR